MSEKRIYGVTVPIAGHAYIEVEASSEEEAQEMAFQNVEVRDMQEWDALKQFIRGNVCYCPAPWEVEIEDLGSADE